MKLKLYTGAGVRENFHHFSYCCPDVSDYLVNKWHKRVYFKPVFMENFFVANLAPSFIPFSCGRDDTAENAQYAALYFGLVDLKECTHLVKSMPMKPFWQQHSLTILTECSLFLRFQNGKTETQPPPWVVAIRTQLQEISYLELVPVFDISGALK